MMQSGPAADLLIGEPPAKALSAAVLGYKSYIAASIRVMKSLCPSRRIRQAAFTLIELLVVIAIIAILAGMRILVVEDEAKVAALIAEGLREEHFTVDIAQDGEEGLYRAKNFTYDLIILDV